MMRRWCGRRYGGWRAAALVVMLAGAACVALGGCIRVGPKPKPDDGKAGEDVISRLKDAVVLIDVALTLPGGEQVGAGGSGFVISKDGKVITNAHVVSLQTKAGDGTAIVATDRKVQVVFHPGTPDEEILDATVERENHDVDLALLKVDKETPTFLLPAESDQIVETAKIYAAGHPLGLREISIRTGTVTAHRTWEGREYIEHDAAAEEGSSGGPVVDEQARVVGVHVQTMVSAGMMTKFAIPSKVLKKWIKSAASDDPAPPTPGDPVRELLVAAGLIHEETAPGTFELPYREGPTVYAHQVEDFLRAYVPLGGLPGADEAAQNTWALGALMFNFSDPVGRLSLHVSDEGEELYWESQIPMSVATPGYLETLCDVAAGQTVRWEQLVADEEAGDPEAFYPGGDKEALTAQLEQMIKDAELKYETQEDRFILPYDNDVDVRCRIYRGMAYTYCYTGGMPGQDDAQKGKIAVALLQRNWKDPFGRLSLDSDMDLAWESQVPMDFLTPDYLAILTGTCARQVADFWEEYGKVPLNGG